VLPIAIYHCSIKIISRGKGVKSAVAAAAYRAAEKIKNEYDGITHDYTRKRGVVYSEILMPDHAPAEYTDRSILWNSVEKIEKAKNSQLAREIQLALPVELTREQPCIPYRRYSISKSTTLVLVRAFRYFELKPSRLFVARAVQHGD